LYQKLIHKNLLQINNREIDIVGTYVTIFVTRYYGIEIYSPPVVKYPLSNF